MNRRTILCSFLVLTGLFLMAGTACAGVGDDIYGSATAPPSVDAGIPTDWKMHQAGNGASIRLPPGWIVREKPEGFLLAYRPGPDGKAVELVAADRVEVDGRAASVLGGLERMYPDLVPSVKVSAVKAVSGDGNSATARLEYRVGGRSFRGSALCDIRGKVGTICLAASETASWEKNRPTLVRILSTYREPGPPGPGRETAPRGGTSPQDRRIRVPDMVLWRDPVEGAFEIPVPKGWSVEGGMRRAGAIDLRPEVLAVSPDRGVLVRHGDAFIMTMQLPAMYHQMLGLAEGSVNDVGGGHQQLILRYLPGASYAVDFYLPRRVGPVSNVAAKDLPEISRLVQASLTSSGLPIRVDTGEVTFDASVDGKPKKGYAFVQTWLIHHLDGQPAGWTVSRFLGYLADPGQEGLASLILSRMASGFRLDPTWEARQLQVTGEVSRITADTSREIERMRRQTSANKDAAFDRMRRNESRAALGETIVKDPATGEEFLVPAGADVYTRGEGTDVVIGTQSGAPAPFEGTGISGRVLDQME